MTDCHTSICKQLANNCRQVHVPIIASSGSGKGFAYLQFDDPESAVQALKEVDGTVFQGRLVHILPAAAKRETKLDEYAISKLPLKKQKQIQRKAEASSSTFNWNALYMNVCFEYIFIFGRYWRIQI